jgi:hypothetical protein
VLALSSIASKLCDDAPETGGEEEEGSRAISSGTSVATSASGRRRLGSHATRHARAEGSASAASVFSLEFCEEF